MAKIANDTTAANTTSQQSTTTENNCNTQKSLEVLSALYKNVTMAQSSVKTILPYAEDACLTKTLHKQVERYDEHVEKIHALAKNLGFEPTPAPQALLSMANMGIRMKMLTNKTESHIAKIMLQGTLNGLIDLYRLQKDIDDVHPDVSLLLKQTLRYEEACFEDMKGNL